ncbi:MAG: hypothetical protein AAFO29_06445 [Actinomycetota bacterium]
MAPASPVVVTGGARRLIARFVATLLGVVVLVAAPGAAGAVIDDPDLDTGADYRYRVDPDDGQVEVTIQLTVTADKPNRTTSTGYFQYYFDGTFLAIPAEVGDLAVTDLDGQPLEFEIDETVPDIIQLFIDFRRNLFFQETTDVLISFTLPGGAARGDELTRVNGAYAGFQAWVDPRLEAASLTVITPPGFVDRSAGSEAFAPAERRTGPDGSELWFVADDIDPEFQWASVSMARDEALVTTEFEVDIESQEDIGFDVLAWPGDQVWTDFVTENLDAGLPLLADEIGLPWPLDDDLTVIESYDPYLSGYAGWYDVRAAEIEIGDVLDSHVMFHELSHVWFNGNLFEERWITEGLADEFGAEVVEALGDERPTPPRTTSSDSAAVPLNRWLPQTEDVDEEEWAYGASWSVTRAMADVVGLEVLSTAAQAAAGDEIAYLGDGAAETLAVDRDWRLYLDLIENRGGVTGSDITDLFEEWIVAPTEVDGLTERADSRARYAALDEAGDAWAPPLAVRRALSRWEFDRADDLMVDAGEILERRAETLDVLDEVAALLPAGSEVGLPDRLEQAYEGAPNDLDDAETEAEDALAAAEELRASGSAIDAATGPLERIGAIGSDHRGELALAAAEFTDGEFDGAVAEADRIEDDVDRLAQRGLLRVVAAVGSVLALIAVIWWLRRRRRSRLGASPSEPVVATGNGASIGPEEGSDGATETGEEPSLPVS